MSFVLKCSSFTLYAAFLIASITVLLFTAQVSKISCVLLASKIDANANLIFLALAIANAHVYK